MTELKRALRTIDGLAMVVGIMVGSGIFRTPGLLPAYLGRPPLTFVALILGGAVVAPPPAGVHGRARRGRSRYRLRGGRGRGLGPNPTRRSHRDRDPRRHGARVPGGGVDLLRLPRRREDRRRSGRSRPHSAAGAVGRDRDRHGAVPAPQRRVLPGAPDRAYRGLEPRAGRRGGRRVGGGGRRGRGRRGAGP